MSYADLSIGPLSYSGPKKANQVLGLYFLDILCLEFELMQQRKMAGILHCRVKKSEWHNLDVEHSMNTVYKNFKHHSVDNEAIFHVRN